MDTPEVGKFYLNWVKTNEDYVDDLWRLRRNFLMKNPNNTNSARRIKKGAKTKFVEVMNRIDGKVTNLQKNFSRMKAAQNNEKSKYEDTWIKEAIEAAMDIRVLLHIEMRASGKPNAEIEKRIYNCFMKYGDSGKKAPAAEASKPEPTKPAASEKKEDAADGAKAKCDTAKKTSKECEEVAAEEAKEKKRREREE